MNIQELKGKLDFFTDALFQAGYDLGWEAALSELDDLSNVEWNMGNKVTAEVIRKAVKQIRQEYGDVDVA